MHDHGDLNRGRRRLNSWPALNVSHDAEDNMYGFSVLVNDILDKHASINKIKNHGRPFISDEIEGS